MKLDRLKICFGYDMAADEFKPDKIAAGVKKVVPIIFFKIFFLKEINSNLTDNSYLLGPPSEKRIKYITFCVS